MTITTARDRIIADRGWTADLAKIVNTRLYTYSDHRAVLAYELRRAKPRPLWLDIAATIGYGSKTGAIVAAHRRDAAEARFKTAHQRKVAEQYGMTT